MFKNIFQLPVTLFHKYSNALIHSPYKTKMISAGIGYFVGDVVCQMYMEQQNSDTYDFKRSIRQALVGAFFAGPTLHLWHTLGIPRLNRYFPNRIPRVLASVFLHAAVLDAYLALCLLFLFESLRTWSVEAGIRNVKNKFVTAYVNSLKFWTGLSFISYGVVPVHFRPIFANVWTIAWQSYLSYVSNNKAKSIGSAFTRK